MKKIIKHLLNNNQGFAIIAALMALLVITAVGTLVFTLTTKDIRVSARVIGEKKAFSGAESGVHSLIAQATAFAKDPNIETEGFAYRVKNYSVTSMVVNSSIDQDTKYSIPQGNSGVSLQVSHCDKSGGHSIESGGDSESLSGQGVLLDKSIRGENTRYSSKVQLDLGICYGPVPGGT